MSPFVPGLVIPGLASAAGRRYLVSTGRFALRGIGRAQDLNTLDPGIASDEAAAGGYARYLKSWGDLAATSAFAAKRKTSARSGISGFDPQAQYAEGVRLLFPA